MKLITRDTDYAVKALKFIAGHSNGIISVKELVKELKIPRPFLRKILQALNKKGVLTSYKGRGGGFILACEPAKIFLVDLMEIFQGPVRLNECSFKKKNCPDINRCALNRKICGIEKYVISQLKNISLESLLG